MIYRSLGRTGKSVSVIGFGGMRFFNKDEDTAMATVRRCLDMGINFFETGGGYGNGKSEKLIGQALKGRVAREDIVLANKAVAASMPDAAQVRKELEAALKTEQTDYFDLFSFWGTNTPEMMANILKPGGPLAELEKAKEEGLIRGIGITTHARQEWILDFVKAYPWDAVTLKEHLLYSRQQEVIKSLGERGISVIVMSPLAGGVVATPGADIAARLEQEGLTAPYLGLRYLVSNPDVTTAISGMTLPEEVEENARAGEEDAPLSEAERRLTGFIREKTTALGEKFCTSCGYCQPCPHDVNIPGIFRLWNLMRGYGSDGYSKLEYQKLREQRHWADFPGASAENCVECGECEEKCPENLPIMEDLKRAHADLTAK